MSLDSMDRVERYLDQTGRSTLTPKQERRSRRKALRGHVQCEEGREYDGSPSGRCVICGRGEDDFLPGMAGWSTFATYETED